MKTKICPVCGIHNLVQKNICANCGEDITITIPHKIENSIIDDLISIFSIPFKEELPGSYPKYPYIFNKNLLTRVIALLLVNNLFLIIVSTQMLYTLLDMVGWFILTVTSFLLSSIVQTFIFRKFSGRGNIIQFTYVNALFVSALIIVSILAYLVIFVIRVRGIDLWVMRIGGIYLLIGSVLAYAKVHQITKTEALKALFVSAIASLPILAGWIFMVAKLLDYRRSQYFAFVVWVVVLSLFITIDYIILSYMKEEQEMAPNYPNGVPINLLFHKFISYKPIGLLAHKIKYILLDKIVYYINRIIQLLNTKLAKRLFVFLVFLTIFSTGWWLITGLNGPVTMTAIENENTISLDFKVIDADFSERLNKIVMVAEESRIIHLLDPTIRIHTSIELPSIAKSVSVSQNGMYAAIGTSSTIVYLDLGKEQIIENYIVDYPNPLMLLRKNWIFVAPSFADTNLIQLEVIDTYRGEKRQFNHEIRLNKIYKLHPHQEDFYAITEDSSALVRIDTMTAEITNFKTGFNNLDDIWFSANGALIITDQANVYTASRKNDQDMKYVGHLNNINNKIIDVANYYINRELLIISVEISEIVAFSDHNFEEKYRIPLPELIFEVKKGVLPFSNQQKYKVRGHFLFISEHQDQCYTIVQPITSSEAQNHFSVVINDLR